MCITPVSIGYNRGDYSHIPELQLVACRNCWQCRANRVNDLVGRCIAEQETSRAAYALTLTYAGDGPNSAVLVYRDFQLFMKKLRKKGYSVRYIVAGEYGSQKGRAHWHAVLFFDDLVPEVVPTLQDRKDWQVVLNKRFNWEPWEHGFVFFQEPDYGGFAYVLKYALKNLDADVSKGHLAMSKKPPLGHQWFQDYADRYVEQGLAPQDLFYSFGHVFDAKRRRRQFMIQGKTRENFIERFCDRWSEVHGTKPPVSQALFDHWDAIAAGIDADQWREYIVNKMQESADAQPLGVVPFDPDMDSWEDPENWFYVHHVLPVALWDIAPAYIVEEAQKDRAVRLTVYWDKNARPSTLAGQEVPALVATLFWNEPFHGEERMASCALTEEELHPWKEWFRSLRAMRDPGIWRFKNALPWTLPGEVIRSKD